VPVDRGLVHARTIAAVGMGDAGTLLSSADADFGDHSVYWECREARMDDNHRDVKGLQSIERQSGDLCG
jgi:hypothetical protein